MPSTTNPIVPAKVWSESVDLPKYVDAKVLAANTSETYTIPDKAVWALITADGGFYIDYGATAAIPAADITDGTSSFYIPTGTQVRVPAGVQVAVISSATRVITIACYPAA